MKENDGIFKFSQAQLIESLELNFFSGPFNRFSGFPIGYCENSLTECRIQGGEGGRVLCL